MRIIHIQALKFSLIKAQVLQNYINIYIFILKFLNFYYKFTNKKI